MSIWWLPSSFSSKISSPGISHNHSQLIRLIRLTLLIEDCDYYVDSLIDHLLYIPDISSDVINLYHNHGPKARAICAHRELLADILSIPRTSSVSLMAATLDIALRDPIHYENLTVKRNRYLISRITSNTVDNSDGMMTMIIDDDLLKLPTSSLKIEILPVNVIIDEDNDSNDSDKIIDPPHFLLLLTSDSDITVSTWINMISNVSHYRNISE